MIEDLDNYQKIKIKSDQNGIESSTSSSSIHSYSSG